MLLATGAGSRSGSQAQQRGAGRATFSSAHKHVALGVPTHTCSVSWGTQHSFSKGILLNICFHISEKGGRAGRTIRLPTFENIP